MKKVLVILGPSATGKTALGIELAKQINGEIVSADSRQVYRGLDIGSNKLPQKNVDTIKKKGCWIVENIPIWMFDVAAPQRNYSAYKYLKKAERIVEKISQKGKLPIVVGGTGLYIRVLLKGLCTTSKRDKSLRKKLDKLSVGELQEQLCSLSKSLPELNQSDWQNKRRLIRKIEILINPTQSKSLPGLKASGADILKIGLTASKDFLIRQVSKRVKQELASDVIAEVKQLISQGVTYKRLHTLGLDYGIIADFLEGKINSEAQLLETLILKNKQYIKRQLTWFNQEENVHWFNISNSDFISGVEKKVFAWYYSN